MTSTETNDLLSQIDIQAIALPEDKITECKYFMELASSESDSNKFRWLISAFFNAAYSFFEITALSAFNAYHDPETGEPIEDSDALVTLRNYVKVSQNKNKPSFVNTAGLYETTERLYKLRKGNTHHYPLSIMATGSTLPEDFHFGHLKDKGIPALKFCREVMTLIEGGSQRVGIMGIIILRAYLQQIYTPSKNV